MTPVVILGILAGLHRHGDHLRRLRLRSSRPRPSTSRLDGPVMRPPPRPSSASRLASAGGPGQGGGDQGQEGGHLPHLSMSRAAWVHSTLAMGWTIWAPSSHRCPLPRNGRSPLRLCACMHDAAPVCSERGNGLACAWLSREWCVCSHPVPAVSGESHGKVVTYAVPRAQTRQTSGRPAPHPQRSSRAGCASSTHRPPERPAPPAAPAPGRPCSRRETQGETLSRASAGWGPCHQPNVSPEVGAREAWLRALAGERGARNTWLPTIGRPSTTCCRSGCVRPAGYSSTRHTLPQLLERWRSSTLHEVSARRPERGASISAT